MKQILVRAMRSLLVFPLMKSFSVYVYAAPRPPRTGRDRRAWKVSTGRSILRQPTCRAPSGSGGDDGGGGFEAKLGHGHLAHLELLDLARDRHRERVDELPVARDLVRGDFAPAEGHQVVIRDPGTLARLHPGHDFFAVALAGHADDLDIAHVGVGVQEFLDLARIDVLAAADNHVLDAPDDVDVALVVHGRQVTGVHPARGVDGLTGRFGIVPVTEHDAVAARAQLARLTPQQDLASWRVDDLDLDVGVNPTDGRHALVERVVGAALGRDRRGLGHAIADGHFGHVHLRLD